jgi:hypothetical protein
MVEPSRLPQYTFHALLSVVVLGVAGFALLFVAVTAAFDGLNPGVTIAFLVFGTAMLVFATFGPRMVGPVELSHKGLKVVLDRIDQVKNELNEGLVLSVEDLRVEVES